MSATHVLADARPCQLLLLQSEPHKSVDKEFFHRALSLPQSSLLGSATKRSMALNTCLDPSLVPMI